jgi:hypothetical protein
VASAVGEEREQPVILGGRAGESIGTAASKMERSPYSSSIFIIDFDFSFPFHPPHLESFISPSPRPQVYLTPFQVSVSTYELMPDQGTVDIPLFS